MSFSFVVPGRIRVPIEAILDDLFPEDLVFREGELEGEHWPEGYVHAYRHGKSARAVEVGFDEDGYYVRIMSCANRTDHELALELIRRFSQATGVPIEPEDRAEAVSAEALMDQYGDEWIDQQLVSLTGVLITMVDREQQTLTLSGTRRSYHLGPKHLARLRAAGPEEELDQRLLDDVLRVNHVGEDELFEADVMQLRRDEGDDGFTLAVIGADVDYFLPSVERYAIHSGSGPILIDRDRLEEVVGADRVEWVDEAQAIVRAIPEGEWAEVERRAQVATLDVEASEREPKKRRPWWKLWGQSQ